MIWDASYAIIHLLQPGPGSVLEMMVGKRVLEMGAGSFEVLSADV
jgi:hypothetical protein